MLISPRIQGNHLFRSCCSVTLARKEGNQVPVDSMDTAFARV
jgi:hypothetical protein